MQNSDRNTSTPGVAGPTIALAGVALAFIGGLFIAQAGGGDREFFLSIGFLFGAAGLLGIVVGGVALGIRMAR